MNDYWSIEQLQAEDQNVQFKVLYDMKYLGFLVKEPLEEEIVIEPEGVIHPLNETRNEGVNVNTNASEDEEGIVYCCGRELEEDWIQCDYPKCETGWYHFSCAGITTLPMGKWYCKNCMKAIEEKIKIYEEKVIIKKIKTIQKSQSTTLPLWLANQFKTLKLSIFKIPFHYSERFRNRCLEDSDFQQDLAKKSKFWFYTGALFASSSRDPRISNDFCQILVQRLNHLITNTKTFKKDVLLFHTFENNNKKKKKMTNKANVFTTQPLTKNQKKKMNTISIYDSNKNKNMNNNKNNYNYENLLLIPQQLIGNTINSNLSPKLRKENKPALRTEKINNKITKNLDEENINEKKKKNQLFEQIITNQEQETFLDRENKRKFEELLSKQVILKKKKKNHTQNQQNNNQTNDSNILEQMEFKKRRQIQKLPMNNNKKNENGVGDGDINVNGNGNEDNFNNKQIRNEKINPFNDDDDLNSINQLLKEKLIIKRNRVFENFILWNNSQWEKDNLMKNFNKNLKLSKEEKKFFEKLSKLERNIYLYWIINVDKFQKWVAKYQ
ncbi:inhibitor of growth protein [Anaeramoeba flamelloides]|uniref:Inhibitor of growth protein n=1 Tax=Anaeramoeba flamelloides TaxID=1746091 RepID=A0AAV7YE33_9EUKA|nr:inhibitor of growth protein [Anaeramoeba flamelloides]